MNQHTYCIPSDTLKAYIFKFCDSKTKVNLLFALPRNDIREIYRDIPNKVDEPFCVQYLIDNNFFLSDDTLHLIWYKADIMFHNFNLITLRINNEQKFINKLLIPISDIIKIMAILNTHKTRNEPTIFIKSNRTKKFKKKRGRFHPETLAKVQNIFVPFWIVLRRNKVNIDFNRNDLCNINDVIRLSPDGKYDSDISIILKYFLKYTNRYTFIPNFVISNIIILCTPNELIFVSHWIQAYVLQEYDIKIPI